FQAEDGIRDKLVTGVQTCALPISDGGAGANHVSDGDHQQCRCRWLRAPRLVSETLGGRSEEISQICVMWGKAVAVFRYQAHDVRSEERRVGKECRSRGGGNEWSEK